MKKITILFFAFIAYSASLYAVNYNITISGTSYSPNLLTVTIGDNVTIMASNIHPLVQVTKATWLADGNTAMTGGWGIKTTDYTFNATVADTIYFVCEAHASIGMKGRIIVQSANGISDLQGKTPGISLYPNPVSTTATLQLNNIDASNTNIKVYDITGQIVNKYVMVSNGSFSKTIDVSNLNNGVYFITVLEGNNKYIKKFSVIK